MKHAISGRVFLRCLPRFQRRGLRYSRPAPPMTASAEQLAASTTAQVETITVTARRKSENEQNVPISETVVTGEHAVRQRHHQRAQTCPTGAEPAGRCRSTRATPISASAGLGSNIGLANDGIESGVGVYVDGVFLPRPAEATFDLPDVATIEVLRGPQGTLYGKNTTSGAIAVTTELPTSDWEGQASASSATTAMTISRAPFQVR